MMKSFPFDQIVFVLPSRPMMKICYSSCGHLSDLYEILKYPNMHVLVSDSSMEYQQAEVNTFHM